MMSWIDETLSEEFEPVLNMTIPSQFVFKHFEQFHSLVFSEERY